jgi:polyisoprenyl-teichoic acid--peptidoglycan teichoic acid transferase
MTAASTLPSPLQRSRGISLRRGLVLMGFSVLIPGIAQAVAGNRRLGRLAVRVWLITIAVVVVVGLLALPFRNAVIAVYANPITLTVLQFAVLAYGIAWSLLLLDAWRIADPRAMSRVGAVVSGLLALVLAVTGTGVAWATSDILAAQRSLFGDVFGGGGSAQTVNGRYNVLLLGGDAGKGREGLRPDSMTVASIDAETGRTVLFSLPRNLQRAPFPVDSPLHKLYPNGYYCPEKPLAERCMLNGIYTLAQQNKKLFPGVKYPGVEATKSSIEEILGLKINYWAMIDLKGFEKLIDAVGGITLDIGKKVPIGSLHSPKGVYDWIPAGKNQHLDGFQALWFARSREYSNDYERMIRQKCVMNAMLKQLDPTTVVTKFQKLADAGKQIVATNLPADQIGPMMDLAMKAKTLPMASVSFTPPTLKAASGDYPTVNPDFADILAVVTASIAASEAKDDPAAQPTASSSSTATKKPSKKKSTSTTTDNLDSICKVS